MQPFSSNSAIFPQIIKNKRFWPQFICERYLCRRIVRKSTTGLKIYHTPLRVRHFIRMNLVQPFSSNSAICPQIIKNKRFWQSFSLNVIYIVELFANPPQGCKYAIRHSEGDNLYELIYRRHFLRIWKFVRKLSKISFFWPQFLCERYLCWKNIHNSTSGLRKPCVTQSVTIYTNKFIAGIFYVYGNLYCNWIEGGPTSPNSICKISFF